jgi:hypothetical protein
MIPRDIIEMEALAFHFHTRPIRWKRSTGDFVDSHCRLWHITPVYGGLTRPESYVLWFGVSNGKWKRVGSGQTQRECKASAEAL